MIKTFVTIISLQFKEDLLKMIYNPVGFAWEQNVETSFPIVPVIANEVYPGEPVKIIVIRTVNEDTEDNFEVFVEELSRLQIGKDSIIEIAIEENQSKEKGVDLLLRVLEAIPEDSLVYADITFGTKPMSAMLLYAMSFIEKVKDSEVQGIYYGEIPREKGEALKERAALYDLTTLKYMGDMIEQFQQLDIKEPLTVLRKMLD